MFPHFAHKGRRLTIAVVVRTRLGGVGYSAASVRCMVMQMDGIGSIK